MMPLDVPSNLEAKDQAAPSQLCRTKPGTRAKCSVLLLTSGKPSEIAVAAIRRSASGINLPAR